MIPEELGDFQTPLPLVRSILRALAARGGGWTRALEPTCGRGNFILGLQELPDPPREVIRAEIQDRRDLADNFEFNLSQFDSPQFVNRHAGSFRQLVIAQMKSSLRLCDDVIEIIF